MKTKGDPEEALRWMWKISRFSVGIIPRTPEEIVSALAIEQLPYNMIPKDIFPDVRAFRKLSRATRLALAKRFFDL